MQGILFIRDLAVVMLIAGGAAWLCQRLRLSAVVGYLVAGAVIGPHTPPFALVADLDRVQTLAQVGLVFLIFSVGMNLSLDRLRNLGFSMVAAAAIGALLVLNGCRVFGWALGWGTTASLFLAGMLMVSSSAIISKVLDEFNLSHERPGQMALGITVIEDVVAVLMLTLLTSLVQFGGERGPALLPTLWALGAFVVFLAMTSLLLAPRLLTWVSRQAQPEVRTLVVLGLLLSSAWLAAQAGYSMALGAFVCGAIMGSTRYRREIERSFAGIGQMFGAVFFVAIGMLVEFRLLGEAWPLVLGVTALALVLRPLACSVGLVLVGNKTQDAVQAGLALTPLGEFSFVIAQLGVTAGVVPPAFQAVAVGASLLTALAAPVLTRRSEQISQRIGQAEPGLVREWVAFYHDWLMRLRTRQAGSLLWRLSRTRLLQVAVQVLFISALVLFAGPAYQKATAALTPEWIEAGVLLFVFWTGFGLLLLAPLIALWRNVSALAMMAAESATTGLPRAPLLRPLLEAALRSVASVIIGVWLLALLPSGWSLVGVAGAVLGLLAVVAMVFWPRLVRLHSRLEIEIREQLRQAAQGAGSSSWSELLLRQPADWHLDIDEITLPGDSAHAGRSLAELGIRHRYGCSVVGIDRQGYGIANPGADTAVYPLDRLLLLGSAEDLGRAAASLGATEPDAGRASDFSELTMEAVVVPSGCPLAGRPLAELDLIRQAGVQIGGIRRGPHRRLNPGGRDRFEAGEELLVLGTHAQIKEFLGRLAPAEPGGGGGNSPA